MSSELLEQIRRCGRIPRHVAIIMDGNGRWALQRGLPRHAGHREGMKAVQRALEAAVELGIQVLTLFAFSTQNWQRPPDEISALMSLLEMYARKERAELKRRGVKVRVLGDLERLSSGTRRAVQGIMRATEGGETLQLNLMISYSGRDEILRAARRLAEEVREGRKRLEDIDESTFQDYLFTGGVPDPDLLIRTSGERRLSNFMLWQLAYTEVYVTPVLWPDFTREDFFAAIVDFQRRERRFGRVDST